MKNSYYDKIKTVRIHKQQFDSINEKSRLYSSSMY